MEAVRLRFCAQILFVTLRALILEALLHPEIIFQAGKRLQLFVQLFHSFGSGGGFIAGLCSVLVELPDLRGQVFDFRFRLSQLLLLIYQIALLGHASGALFLERAESRVEVAGDFLQKVGDLPVQRLLRVNQVLEHPGVQTRPFPVEAIPRCHFGERLNVQQAGLLRKKRPQDVEMPLCRCGNQFVMLSNQRFHVVGDGLIQLREPGLLFGKPFH